MINNWEIISRLEPKTKSLLYCLVIDGTEHDARLIAKKLSGYAQPPVPALAPYIYNFELPADLDEDTLEKIRTAAREGVEQTNKINQFVPGGVLGDPLFNGEAVKEDKDFPTFMTLDPSQSFFRTPKEQVSAPPTPQEEIQIEKQAIRLDSSDGLDLQKQTLTAPQEESEGEQFLTSAEGEAWPENDERPAVKEALPAKEPTEELSINDKDMLIKDMEGTLLDQMPLEDIFSAETKYDMFLDLDNQQLVKASQTQRERKMTTLADGKDSLEETFNVFEQKIKDQTCIIDLDDLNNITEQIAKKDLSFVKDSPSAKETLIQANHAVPGESAEVLDKTPQQQPTAPTEQQPLPPAKPVLSQAETQPLKESVLQTPSLPPKLSEKPVPPIQHTPNLPEIPAFRAEPVSAEQPPVPAEQPTQSQPYEEPSVLPATPEATTEKDALAAAVEAMMSKTSSTNQVSAFEEPESFRNQNAARERLLGSTADILDLPIDSKMKEPEEMLSFLSKQTFSVSSAESSAAKTATALPEEVKLADTIPPARHHSPADYIQDDGDLPSITIRGKRPDNLEKTFNLETTINTEVIKSQYMKTLHEKVTNKQTDNSPEKLAGEQPKESAPARKKFRLLGKKNPDAENTKTIKQSSETKEAGKNMAENNEEKTTFRIRKIQREATLPPQPPLPPPAQPAPAQPQMPQEPIPATLIQTTPPIPPVPTLEEAPVAPAVAAPQAPAHKTILRGPTSANTLIEKTKTIDHSIELPLSELKKHNWPLEVPLVPTFTMENMVMSVNRFAHATAISVVDNPGRLYNPLVLHGPTGTGKTHFLNAIGYALSKKYGQENIFMTNGVRLSRGIQRYVMENNMEKFEKFMDSVKALLIDDIHLIAINEQNRVYISNLLNKFLREQKQIVITSKYPPESLEKLEELIKFKLDSGWISELKTAAGATHFRIVKKMLMDNGVNITDSQISEFFGGPHMTLGTVQRSIRRVKVLEKIVFPGMPGEERSQAKIFDKLLATAGEDKTSEILERDISEITTIPNVGDGEWGRIGFFYPQNSSHMMNWMVYALGQRAKELGIEGGFEIAVRSSYSTENIISSAFKIANLCDNKKLKGAVILGPALTGCDPSVRENFYDILTHMLEVMLIRCGIINYEDVKSPSTYVKIISELMR